MAEKKCGFCNKAVASEAKICPDCGFDFEPKPVPAKVELTDEQLSALMGFEAAKAELLERTAPADPQQAKLAKMGRALMLYFVIPSALGLALEQMHLFGGDKGGGLDQMASKFGKTLQQQRQNKDLIDAAGRGADK